MDNIVKEKAYKISRIILAALAFIIFNIMFINEDISWKILPPIFALITFGLSFPSSIISKKLLEFTKKINNKIIKGLFYMIALPIIIFVLFLAIYGIVFFAVNIIPTPNEFGAALGQAIMGIFIIIIGTIGIILPYIQTIIVLILNKLMK